MSTGAGGNYRSVLYVTMKEALHMHSVHAINTALYPSASQRRVITVYTGVPYRGVTSLLSINYVHANCQQDNIVTVHSGVAHEHHLHYGIDTDERPRA